MKAITVIQPWASLLAVGEKRIETRSWRTNYRGEILIHAGKKVPLWGICMMDDAAKEKVMEIFGNKDGIISNQFRTFPTGAIIGKANLVNCLRIDELTMTLIKEQHPVEYVFGDFTPGRYAWVMSNPVLFENLIPASGKQGLWNWKGGI